ncbi:cytochrome P450 CYP82D47-like [Cucumis melo var. makuwa]|uniref:Cytochrome P450 CYP82D47-like n=1 Tax=Cucumis melo var. makuwa TaxID=1194695 RepID=A0A5A7SHT5_CUCMM|nr:cytochrome P450 CYP82D47-like [Cucumis melo var. makuwa]TYK06158.1 cytochrome P450 CYP82D47-like [Cucumis melo var. makuwa]
MNTLRMTLCASLTLNLQWLKLIVHHITDDFMYDGTMSSFLSDFKKTDALFLKFDDELNNVGGSSLMDNNSDQMLELQSQPILEDSQPLSRDEICEKVLSRQPGYSKGLGWGPKPKSRKSCVNNSSTSFLQAREVKEAKALIKPQRVELEEAKSMIEEQRRTSELHT